MELAATRTQNATPRYTLMQGMYWMVYCILVSFSSVYLLDRGFSNTEMGILVGVSSVLSALIQPLAASVADRSKRLALRQWSALMALAMLVVAALLLFWRGKAVQAGCYMLLLVILQVMTPFTYSLGMECVNRNIPLNYGIARSAGAIAYALASSACGVVVKERGAGVLPLALLLLTALLIPVYLTFRFRGGEGETGHGIPAAETPSEEVLFLKKYRRLLPLLAGVVLLFISHNIILTFPYQIVQGLGG